MRTSESVSKIATALIKAQQAITFAAKDSKNPAFKSTYANLESVIEAIKTPLNEAGIVFIQAFMPSQPGYMCLTTRLIHTSGEWIEGEMVVPMVKQDAQGFGSATTYSRRYALAAITGLYQADDDGNEASAAPPAPPAPKQVAKPVPAKEVDLMALLAAMDSAKDIGELKQTFAAAWKESSGNASIKTHYEKLKTTFTEGHTIDRSEYPERVLYEADRVRYLIGERAERPYILDYDADKHSGYVKPSAPAGDALDAAIYRWLRDKAVRNNENSSPVVIMLHKHGEHGEPLDFIVGYELDNEIDKARNAKGGA